MLFVLFVLVQRCCVAVVFELNMAHTHTHTHACKCHAFIHAFVFCPSSFIWNCSLRAGSPSCHPDKSIKALRDTLGNIVQHAALIKVYTVHFVCAQRQALKFCPNRTLNVTLHEEPSGCWSTAPHAVVLTLVRAHYYCVYFLYAVSVDVLTHVDLHKTASR